MKIYRATIFSSSNIPFDDEPSGVDWEAYGADKKALKALQTVAALKIAPDAAWAFDERHGTASVTVGDRDYLAECVSIELVC